ncbi:kinesin-like protein KIN-4A [Rutidosis leptorrhynchoides]|uniref:kinesin-like protein KIN-4A n=1 Tax=Rutidosis leptorrhynchoides TaxID=125765 RepID=UPI003A98D707
MENSPENCNVKVALHIRPLLRHERQNGGEECLDVVPGTAQVLMGSHSFIFDHVYGGGGSPSNSMFEECALPLLDALFQGYNGTVIAYGQTGSGKTYTMGTNPKESSHRGLIFQVMNTIFTKIETLKDQTEFQLHVSFIEILKEEVRDLLDSGVIDRRDTSDENSVSGKQQLQIRKAPDGALNLSGSTEVSVSTQKEMTACLEQGCSNRSVASTDMNNQSSRSHAIFTIILEQKDKDKGEAKSSDIMGEEYRCAKLHLVDLAGSERAKRAGSEGVRLKEGIQINKGLLALGNVISALGDDKKRKEGLHIPYRDSKLTRLLQASLGGNCKTVMIACVSPADYNAEETLNTLKYANRARNIQNKASVQKEVFPADTHKLRQQLRLLQAELAHRKEAELVELQDLKRKIDWLETTNSDLHEKINDYRNKCTLAEATNSELLLKIHDYHSKRASLNTSEIDSQTLLQTFTLSQEDNEDSQCTTAPESIMETVASGDISHDTLKEPDKTTRSSEVESLKQRFGEKFIALEEDKRLLQLERDGLRDEITHLEAFGQPTAKEQAMNEEKAEAIEAGTTTAEGETRGRTIPAMEDQSREANDAGNILHLIALYPGLQNLELLGEYSILETRRIKKESRKSEFELNKLMALYQRQTQVLQRKTEEAARATKKLKELMEARKITARRETIKTLKRWLNQEIEKVMQSHKLRIEHEKHTQRCIHLKSAVNCLIA